MVFMKAKKKAHLLIVLASPNSHATSTQGWPGGAKAQTLLIQTLYSNYNVGSNDKSKKLIPTDITFSLLYTFSDYTEIVIQLIKFQNLICLLIVLQVMKITLSSRKSCLHFILKALNLFTHISSCLDIIRSHTAQLYLLQLWL